MQIDKETKIYCSFSLNPGNNGCIFFNKKFKEKNINAIYKSFYSDNLLNSINAVKSLGISGFALSMPFKIEVLNYVDFIDNDSKIIGSANTIINSSNKLSAYNTDWLGVKKFLLNKDNLPKKIMIAGNGGFSKSVQFVCNYLQIEYELITRKNWELINTTDELIFNATPIEILKENIIDARPFTKDGKLIALFQAEEQFKLYTNEN